MLNPIGTSLIVESSSHLTRSGYGKGLKDSCYGGLVHLETNGTIPEVKQTSDSMVETGHICGQEQQRTHGLARKIVTQPKKIVQQWRSEGPKQIEIPRSEEHKEKSKAM
ncbi:hypothetical protein HAX54_004746 [Datura stramonium]|uniref:Uncharacterized protein n=1 Tax=Datura stramonium TaxID=4076 RepID=A0ABS8T9S9_DATST|nr:hypothetical protein [Datura stramonium]